MEDGECEYNKHDATILSSMLSYESCSCLVCCSWANISTAAPNWKGIHPDNSVSIDVLLLKTNDGLLMCSCGTE